MMPFVHLHLHTEYSLMDSTAKIDKIFERAAELNQPAVAITDEGNMYGALHFFRAADAFFEKRVRDMLYQKALHKYEADVKNDGAIVKPVKENIVLPENAMELYPELYVKPIIGCEFYICENHQLKSDDVNRIILLAKNDEGYRNLILLNLIAWVEGFNSEPRIDLEMLEQHNEGLICLSGAEGPIPCYIGFDEYEKAKAYALRLKSTFADGDFYLEIQNHGTIIYDLNFDYLVNEGLIHLAEDIGVKVVATNDVHYIKKTDSETYDVLRCIKTGRYMNCSNTSGDEYYMKSYDEMLQFFHNQKEALDVTVEIASKCNVTCPKIKALASPYSPADGSAPIEFLRKLTDDGLKKMYGKITPEINERKEYELSIIGKMGYEGYFLTSWDCINYARKQGFAINTGKDDGGSIIAYAIGLTDTNPIEKDLSFEKFISFKNNANQNLVVYVSKKDRSNVIHYIFEKYGENKVFHILMIGKFTAKSSIRNIARAYRLPYEKVTKITKLIANIDGITISGILGRKYAALCTKYSGRTICEKEQNELEHARKERSPEIIELYEKDEGTRQIIDMAEKLEGIPCGTGLNATGLVILPDAINNNVPIHCIRLQSEEYVAALYPCKSDEMGLLRLNICAFSDSLD